MEISKYAQGLPALLGLKERGAGPRMFPDMVSGTIDLKDLYLMNVRETLVSTTNVAPAANMNFYPAPGEILQVPTGEMWYVWEYSVAASSGAGASLDFAAAAIIDGSNFSVCLSPHLVAAATQVRRTNLTRSQWFGPGSALGFTVAAVTLAPAVTGTAVITRLRV